MRDEAIYSLGSESRGAHRICLARLKTWEDARLGSEESYLEQSRVFLQHPPCACHDDQKRMLIHSRLWPQKGRELYLDTESFAPFKQAIARLSDD